MARSLADIADQLARARAVIERHFGATLRAIHLFGSALDGGLRPLSDIDLLATVSAAPAEPLRRALMLDLLGVSAPPGSDPGLRALEVTVVAQDEVVPWRYPARRELQFGEWLRADLVRGVFEPPLLDHDLAILLTQVREHGVALHGPPAAACFDAVPRRHLLAALADTLAQWHAEADWAGDERNVVLALARIWYTAVSAHIAPKDVAAAWAAARLPAAQRTLLLDARAAYLGAGDGHRTIDAQQIAALVRHVKSVVGSVARDA